MEVGLSLGLTSRRGGPAWDFTTGALTGPQWVKRIEVL
jgi:hypothetical protein